MMNRIGLLFLVVFFSFPASLKAAEEEDVEIIGCPAAREYVTTATYLRSNKDLAVPEAQVLKIADYVSNGCDGAARRFIRVTNLLVRSGLTGRDAAKIGKEFSLLNNAQTDTFIEIYRKAFLRKFLDLDIGSSVRLARSLSIDYDGDTAIARKDFTRLVRFCTETKGLDLPRPQCGQLAARISRLGVDYENESVARDFVKAFHFIRSHKKGPGNTLNQALQLAEEVVRHGPNSVSNFIVAYRYAASEKGFKAARHEALAFARKMAARSVQDGRFIASEKSKK